jgi:activator of HSP90 ATPase
VLLDSAAFAAFTHGPAHIDPVAGGAFSLFGGQIVGRNIELVPRTRIVQAWRSDRSWEPGVYSIVEFQLSGGEDETVLALRHTGFPEGTHDHLYAGWQAHYFDPLGAYLKHSQ